jgi:hypothetical protein
MGWMERHHGDKVALCARTVVNQIASAAADGLTSFYANEVVHGHISRSKYEKDN